MNIGWDREWPRIIQDLSYLFTNDKKLLKGTRIYEKDEDDENKRNKKADVVVGLPDFNPKEYEDIKLMVTSKFPLTFQFAANAFLVLQGES